MGTGGPPRGSALARVAKGYRSITVTVWAT